MSQTQTEEPNKAAEVIPVDDEDLEDGEIDDSDEEAKDDEDVIIVASSKAIEKPKNTNVVSNHATAPKSLNTNAETSTSVVTVIDSSSDTAPTPPPSNANLIKSKKPTPVEDDHASSIENAIAMALKKKGIEPTIPKVLESKLQHSDDKDEVPAPGQGQSKSSRRRKRKKEKEKERKEKKKRYDSNDPMGPPPLEDEVDMDEYEMLNVRGGSPPPVAALPPSNSQSNMHMYKDQYDSEDDSGGSSYDSYDSEGDDSNSERRRRKRKKESRKRKEKRQREEDSRHDKRSRRDSMDHRMEPRKLELCKFYLMECCAKKDKCSYMHADFPCKYYYLGMECVQKEACKFSHGKPLSEELRNILLKHLETAPKEILGNFKRLSRENSLAMVTKRHEELCRTFNVQNVWAPCTASSLPIHSNRRNNNMNNNKNNNNNNEQQQQHLNKQQQQNTNNSGIPSLLDLVVNPPPNMEAGNNKSTGGEQNKRKSRWADNMNPPAMNNINNQMSIQPPSKTAPAYLDLKNLHGILSAEHIDKLQQLGVVNLEQVNQLTFGQLNQIGLTIAEITEIQLNAINMAKLGVTTGGMATNNAPNVSTASQQSPMKATKPVDSFAAALNKEGGSSSSNGDIDMRFLPSVPPSSTVTTTTAATTSAALGPDKDVLTSSNSNSSSGVVTVDYTQYLKDSNISFDRGDMYDDEKDEEQLVIDDDNTDNEEHHKSTESLVQEPQEKKFPSDSYDNGFAAQLPALTGLSQTFRNPFKTDSQLYGADSKSDASETNRANEKSLAGQSDKKSPERENEMMGSFYGSAARRRYSRESRSRSRTPTRSQSNTPEASQSPQPLQVAGLTAEESNAKDVVYERCTMYDFSSRFAEEDEQRALKTKRDKDMRFLPGGLGSDATASDIDLRLPFQPMTNYTPATEIDGSITSHLPISYKVYEVDVPRPVYVELRQHFKSDHATDPRLRRILGLPELSQSKTSAALSRKVRKTSHSSSIASPSDAEEASPKYYTPPSNTAAEEKPKNRVDPRGDPRAAAEPRVDPRSESRTETRSDPRSDPRRQDPRSAAAANSSNSTAGNSSSSSSAISSGGQKQNIEIRNLLQKSEWYKNLNSKFKIMVNQQLALVSTELKKFHQDPSPNKIFDISFIVNNQTLQQILTNLGIYIDDNGEVAHIDNDNEELMDSAQNDMMGGGGGNLKSNLNLPNMSQPPPNVGPGGGMQQNNPALDFLRAPPPMVVAQGPPPIALGPMFQRPPMQVQGFARPSLLGMPPAGQGNPLNPFANPLNINPNFLAANPNLLGGPFGPNFGPGMGLGPNMQQQQQRNFNNNQRNNQRNNRRKI